MVREIKSKSSLSTFTGIIPAYRIIAEVSESESHDEIIFSIRLISVTAASIYRFPILLITGNNCNIEPAAH